MGLTPKNKTKSEQGLSPESVDGVAINSASIQDLSDNLDGNLKALNFSTEFVDSIGNAVPANNTVTPTKTTFFSEGIPDGLVEIIEGKGVSISSMYDDPDRYAIKIKMNEPFLNIRVGNIECDEYGDTGNDYGLMANADNSKISHVLIKNGECIWVNQSLTEKYLLVSCLNSSPIDITYIDMDEDSTQRIPSEYLNMPSDLFEESENLINPIHCLDGYGIYVGSGMTTDKDLATLSNPIKIVGDKIYSNKYGADCFAGCYDADGFLVSNRVTMYSAETNLPVGTKYILASIYTSFGVADWAISEDPAKLENRFALNSDYINLGEAITTKTLTKGWKNIVADSYGDSQTSGGTWQALIADYFGLTCFTHGVGGSRMSGTADEAMWQDARINALNELAELQLWMAGTNDAHQSATIGTISRDNFDTNTFVGAYNVAISKAYYKYLKQATGFYASNGVDYSGVVQVTNAVDIRLILIGVYYNDSLKEGLEPYTNAVKEIADLWGLPFADVYHEAGVNEMNADLFFGVDKVHGNTANSDRIASVIIGRMNATEKLY